jgi:very-long-chain (3R)-3-hydroxyacyl-CoA dehydratase
LVAEPAVVAEEVKPVKAGKSAKGSKKSAELESSQTEKPKREQSTPVRAYLMAYNAISAAAWAFLLFNLCRSFLVDEPQNYRILFSKTGKYLAYLQTAALLEILHAAAGLVPSDVLANVIQIASRLFIIWVCAIHYQVGKHWGYALLAFAWSLSDLTRYCYYFSQLAGWNGSVLKWARYNFFLVLYPVGTLGEVMLLLWARQKTIKEPHIYWPFLAVIAAYAPGKNSIVES